MTFSFHYAACAFVFIDFFVENTAKDQKKRIVSIDDDVMDFLMHYDYPGNVRELRNIIERMIALSINGRITMNELSMNPDRLTAGSGDDTEQDLRSARGVFEKNYITESLNKHEWNVEKTAASLGITSRQLWNKIKQYDIRKS